MENWQWIYVTDISACVGRLIRPAGLWPVAVLIGSFGSHPCQRPLEAGQALGLPKDCQAFKQAEAHRLARHRQT